MSTTYILQSAARLLSPDSCRPVHTVAACIPSGSLQVMLGAGHHELAVQAILLAA